ncbi:mannose-1-phosphate guanylyltransferase [Legionella beliardensis]|uniref:mannose-1-phosphate guanylyltransferase n=1 Tax=Legionella beliardensis TaxID=91822 RepID=A0A378HZB6_9GAMM|nr:mannose-1-phosphate guanylyltransferase/mannose-6-phosphate isomerase [Legionella beliardensis]STX27715.1 mannose-1-phosphate guanylyltransferase [Legionella beliardensis]
MSIIPTILCGGAGSRLWPVSRELHPKPFIRLNDGQSFLQKAFLRAASIPNVKEILTVTNRELFFKTEDEYRAINQHNLFLSYILEPFGRNTAAAIALAALQVAKKYGDDAILLILPADHLISEPDAFQSAVDCAIKLAKNTKLVTFGIKPNLPESGYGYIQIDENSSLTRPKQPEQILGYSIKQFVEKPSVEKAQEYLQAGCYFWNSGMFCFTAGAALKHLEHYCNDIYETTKKCLDDAVIAESPHGAQIQLKKEHFTHVLSNSFDYAVMEPASKDSDAIAVIPCDLGWSDIGSWSAFGDLSTADTNGNRVNGEALLYNTENCYIQSDARLISTVGLKNLIIIDTPDAILVADKNHAQDVKHIYTALKEKEHNAYKLHQTVHRPWGTYTILDEGKNFKIKRLEVNPGAKLSLQMHHHRSEHWIVVSGMAKVINGNNELLVRTNESTYIPAGSMHRLENPGVLSLVIIEVQSGEYLGEDDIVRFEDNYGRI